MEDRFHFLDNYDPSYRPGRGGAKNARSHTAKANAQKLREKKTRRHSRSDHASASRSQQQQQKDEQDGSRTQQITPATTDSRHFPTRVDGRPVSPFRRRIWEEDDHAQALEVGTEPAPEPEPETENAALANTLLSSRPSTSAALAPLTRTVSPIWGALPIESFNPVGVSSTVAAEALDICLHIVLQAVDPVHYPVWTQAYLSQPLIFHTILYGASSIQHLRNRTSKNELKTLTHKARTIQLLNEALQTTATASALPEGILMAAVGLWLLDDSQAQQIPTDCSPLLFNSHQPDGEGLQILAHPEQNVQHAQAVERLLRHMKSQGRDYTLPGLEKAISTISLLAASFSVVRPMVKVPALNLAPFESLATTLPQLSGGGFAEGVCQSLPARSIRTFTLLASMNSVLAHIKSGDFQPSREERSNTMATRDQIHHHLLRMPAWDKFAPRERETVPLPAYEACRLTAIAFSNAILFPLPTSKGWHLILLGKLHGLFEEPGVTNWLETHALQLLIWTLLIANITVFGTQYRVYFLQLIYEILQKHHLSWSDVQTSVNRYL